MLCKRQTHKPSRKKMETFSAKILLIKPMTSLGPKRFWDFDDE